MSLQTYTCIYTIHTLYISMTFEDFILILHMRVRPKFTFRECHSQICYCVFHNTSGPWPLNFRNKTFLNIYNSRSQGCLKVLCQGKCCSALNVCDAAFHGTPVWQMGQSYVIIYSINIGCMKRNVVFFEIKKSITHIFPDGESNHYFLLDSLGWNPA